MGAVRSWVLMDGNALCNSRLVVRRWVARFNGSAIARPDCVLSVLVAWCDRHANETPSNGGLACWLVRP